MTFPLLTTSEHLNMHTRISVPAALLVTVLLAGCGSSGSDSATPTASTDEHAEESHEKEGHEEDGHDDEAKHESPEGVVHLNPAQIKAAGISMATVGPASIRETLSVYGTIAPNAERVREVSARFAGVIRSVNKKVGDSVRQGETLATVESNESLRTYAVTAPLAGVITERNANTGEQAGDKRLFTVADLSTVWVELSLFPRDRARVRVGQKVHVRSTDAGSSGEGQVVYMAPFGSSASQTQTARVLLTNRDRQWAPGLYVNAEIVLSESSAPLTVRSEAIQIIEGKISVFVEGDSGEFVPQPVQTGRSDGEATEIIDGLSLGQRYVTTNSFILKAQMGAGSAEHSH